VFRVCGELSESFLLVAHPPVAPQQQGLARVLQQDSRTTSDGDAVAPEELAKALSAAYLRLDSEFADHVQPAFKLGFESVARVGSCVLTVAITDTHLVVANAGDCRAVLGHADGSQPLPISAKALSRDHNAREKLEQKALALAHPGEQDIVLCKSKTACYVKGRLQPTRSLGDLYLKQAEFNGIPGDRSRGRYIPSPYSPPYILAEPEILVHERSERDRFLILATDGLWDTMSNEEAVAFVHRQLHGDAEPVKKEEIAHRLVREALRREAAVSLMSMQRLMEVPPGKGGRRNLHDDITVVVVFLDDESKMSASSSAGRASGQGGAFSWLTGMFSKGEEPKAERS
jgi:pyruvate dehydrogenase phosphatase